jgi:hypothetical protein
MLTVKRGDTYPVTFTANMDLTGATVRLLAREYPSGPLIELPADIQDAEAGIVVHNLTGDLEVAVYSVELEVTASGVVITFPSDTFELMVVVPDLG